MRHKIPRDVAATAKKGLKLRAKNKTGNANNREGYVMARRLAQCNVVTTATLKKIYAYHQRWEQAEQTEIVKINSLLWGGTAAHSWAEKELQDANS
jgi:hypothetical protein